MIQSAAGTNSGSTLNAGIVGAWGFNGNLNDASGTRNGTENGTISFVAGKNGQCAEFSGTAYVSLSDSPLTGSGGFSLFCWVKCDNTFGGYPGIFACGAEAQQEAVFLALTPAGKVIGTLYALPSGLESTDAVNDGNWHHIGLISTAGSFQLYIDGSANGPDQTFTYNLGAEYAYFGKVYPGGDVLEGKIDDFYLWNRALTTAEVSELYNSGSGKVYPFT